MRRIEACSLTYEKIREVKIAKGTRPLSVVVGGGSEMPNLWMEWDGSEGFETMIVYVVGFDGDADHVHKRAVYVSTSDSGFTSKMHIFVLFPDREKYAGICPNCDIGMQCMSNLVMPPKHQYTCTKCGFQTEWF